MNMMNSNTMETSKTEANSELQYFGQPFENVHEWKIMLRPRSFSDAFDKVLAKTQAQDTAPKAMGISDASDIADPNESIEQMILDCSGYSDVLNSKPTYLPIFPLLEHPSTRKYLVAKIGLAKGMKRQRVGDLGAWDTDRPQTKRRLIKSHGSCLSAASVGRHLFPFFLANQMRFGKSVNRRWTLEQHKRDGKLCKPLKALKAARIMRNIRTVKNNVTEF